MKMDDSREFRIFHLIDKLYDTPKALTDAEKKRLKELGLEVE